MRIPVAVAIALSLSACAGFGGTQPQQTSTTYAQPSSEVRLAQARLRTLGYYNGRLDGLWGPDTAGSVERFQRDEGLTVTARLDQNTFAELRDLTQPTPVTLAN